MVQSYAHDIDEVDGGKFDLFPSAVQPRDRHQAMNDLCHAIALLKCTANTLHDGCRKGRYLYQRLQLTANDRQRGSQFMGRIGRETMIVSQSFLKPFDHAVQCKGKTLQLVSCRNERKPFPELFATYSFRLLC